MPDRESFVSAIAAAPADDLPRLVFADWLEENGDPERAEFIRTQIRRHHAAAEDKKQLDVRAGELFREHWLRWFGPFVLALDPNADLALRYEFRDTGHSATLATVIGGRHSPPASPPAVSHVSVSRGFVSLFGVYISLWGERSSLTEALRYEPPTMLQCWNGLHSPRWRPFTDPSLRRIEWLTMCQEWAWNVSAPDSTAFLDDPHLAGVRNLTVDPEEPEETDPVPLSTAWVDRFTRSPLAYRLTGLCLPNISADGVLPLCRPGRLHLERLELGGELTAEGVRRLGNSDLSGSVRELKLNSAGLDNTATADLARDNWRKLTRLALTGNTFTAAVLPALAAAEFTPRLTELDLSHNPLFDGTDLRGLERLAEALDPERLERLDLTDTGLSHVPDFLTERFGDRVRV